MDPILPGSRHFYPDHINCALRASCSSSQSESNQRLVENCRRAGLRVHGHTPADGNCFFHAVSNQLSLLGLPHQSAAELRRGVVDFLRNHPQIEGPNGIIEFKSYIQSDWTTYLESMCSDGPDSVWADHVILVAMARMLKRDIMVVTSSPGGTDDQAFQWIVGDVNFDGTPIRLGHIWEFHYVSLDSTVVQSEGTAALVTTSIESNPSPSTTASNDTKLVRQKRKRNTEESSYSDSTVAQPESTAALMTSSKGSNPSSSATASHDPKLGRQKRNTEEPSNHANAGMEKLSDRDIKDIANKTYLVHADLHILFHALGMSYAAIENAERNANTTDVKLQAMKVLKEWQKKNGQDASRRRIVDALFECNLMLAKDILEETWGFVTHGMEFISDSDIWDITSKSNLPHAHLQLVFHALYLSRVEIEKAEMAAKTGDVNLQSMNVFRMWRMKNGRKASRARIIDALIKCDFVGAKLILEVAWGLVTPDSDVEIPAKKARLTSTGEHNAMSAATSPDPASRSHDPSATSHDHSGTSHDPAATSDDPNQRRRDLVTDSKVKTWRQQLEELYDSSRREIRFGRRRFDVASIDELCVDLELHEEQFNPTDFVKKGRKLESYLELFSFSESHRILLFGKAGTGKTTQINKIAYDWASKVYDSQSQNQCVQTLCKIKLVLVLDIRKFQSNQTLAEAIKRQLLPGAAINDIDEALEYLKQRCLLLLDGYDEIPKTLYDHALESPHLTRLFVIITTRPHMMDEFSRNHGKYTQVQVLGFSKENVPSYIHKFFKVMQKSELAITLTQKVKETPLLQTLSSFPVLLVMICILWEEQDITFHSMTSLYKDAVSKYLNKPFAGKNAKCLSKPQLKHVLHTLGKTALSELFDNNVQIEGIKFEDTDVLKEAIDMGLVLQTEGMKPDNTSVSFIHKTFQEYCAAVYFSNLLGTKTNQFISWLNQIDGENIDDMSFLLRFCCGLNLKAATKIVDHIVHLGFDLDQTLIYLYETEISHGTNATKNCNLHNKLQSLANKTKVISTYDAELLAAIAHLANNSHAARETCLKEIKSLQVFHDFPSVQAMVEVLGGLYSLECADIHIDSDLNEETTQDLQSPVVSQSLTVFNISAGFGKVCNVHVIPLFSILQCLPAVEQVSLKNVQLTGECKGNPVLLSESLEEFRISDGSTNVTSLVNILGCLPKSTKVSLQHCQLTGTLNDNQVILRELPRELVISSGVFDIDCNVEISSLVSLLQCMPTITRLSIPEIKIIDRCITDPVILRVSSDELRMSACLSINCSPVNIKSLISLLSCIKSTKKVFLEKIQLTGEVDETVILSNALSEFRISNFTMNSSVNVTCLKSLIKCMPNGTKLSIQEMRITDQCTSSPVVLSVLFGHLRISAGVGAHYSDLGIMSVLDLISCMSSLTKVSLDHIELNSELNGYPVMLSESLREFKMSDGSSKITSLVGILGCMPKSIELSLSNIHVTRLDGIDVGFCKLDICSGELKMHGYQTAELGFSGGYACVNVGLFVSLLHCIPQLTKALLQKCQLTGVLDVGPMNLNKSVKTFVMLGCSVNVLTLESLQSYISAVKKASLQQCQLTGEFNTMIIEPFTKLIKSGDGNSQETSLVSLLNSKHTLSKVSFHQCELIGVFSGNPEISIDSLQKFSMSGGSINVMFLVSLLHCISKLTKVSLRQCHLTGGSDCPVNLSESVKEFKHLHHIKLSNIIINSDSASALSQFFKHTPALQYLDLSDNEIGSGGASTLALSFQHTPALLHLDLSDNIIGSDGAVALAQSFQHTPALLHLDLSDNSIGSDGAAALALSFQHAPSLQHLNLSSNSIGSDGASSLAQSFQNTPALQHLSLWNNSIGSDGASALALSFQHTPALQHLNLSSNIIGSDGAAALALSFQHTPALLHLDLSVNSIGSDGAAALALSFQHAPSLQHLNLSSNSIGSDGASSLAQSFQNTPALQHLSLWNNSIGSDGASALTLSFQHTPALQHLNLSSNSIGSDGASSLAQSFQNTPALQHLSLWNNSIGSDGASALALSFQHTPALQHLNLRSNSIGSDGAAALALSFQHTPVLQHLVLLDNSIGSDGAAALALSFQHAPSLQHLDLSRNSIGLDGTTALALSFHHTPALQHIYLWDNSIGLDGAAALALSFQHTPALQHIDLSSNSIGSDGASALALLFQHTPSLQHLDLSSNRIGSDGAAALAQSFQHTPALQHLHLSFNRIGSDGAAALAQSFQHTPALQYLHLSFNRIGSDGAVALAQSFQHTPSLQHIDLSGNSIGTDGAAALAQLLQHTPALQHLHLSFNRIGSDGAVALAQSFQHTPALQHIDLSGNDIGSDGTAALAQSFHNTPALQHLGLSDNSIGLDGTAALALSFHHTPALQHLALSSNSIGSDGAAALALSFQHTPALQYLVLWGNSIGSDGTAALALSFHHTPALLYLNLSSNRIGSDGAATLAQSFHHTPALMHLNLSSNRIGSDGAATLAQSCKHTPALNHLDLRLNNIGADESIEVVQLFQNTPALQNVDLFIHGSDSSEGESSSAESSSAESSAESCSS